MEDEAWAHPGMALEAAAQPLAEAFEIVRRGTGQGGAVQVRPELLDRIQLGGVGGEPLRGEPRAMALDGGAGDSAAVGR